MKTALRAGVGRRLAQTLLFCLGAALAGIFGLHFAQTRETAALTANYHRERADQLREAVAEQSALLGLFAQDYGGWDEMVDFARSLDPEWARINIAEVMERFHLDAVWLAAPAGTVLHTTLADPTQDHPLPAEVLRDIVATRVWDRETGGFYRSGERVFDLRARPVQPSSDIEHLTPPVAWLIAVREMDADALARLGSRLKADAHLHAPPPVRPDPPPPAGTVIVTCDLPAIPAGPPVAEIHAVFSAEALQLGEHYNTLEVVVLVCSGLLMLGGLAWSARRHVLPPLSHIGESLETHSVAPLDRLDPRLADYARIADLVRSSFAQSEALRHEIAERVRLGRDLHDGVIQNLYAAGLGLAQARRLATEDPTRAGVLLDDTIRELNATIATLRGFIARAEPEPTAEVDLAAGCTTLFQTLGRSCDAALELDLAPETRTDLPRAVKADLLLMVREAVSNALRHGRPRHVAVTLRREGSDWILRVRDDGAGFDPACAPAGHGLVNLRARAAELGGHAAFVSAPGQGCEVVVTWPCEG